MSAYSCPHSTVDHYTDDDGKVRCSECNSIADILENAQAPLNDGRGVCCVRSMITYLRRGDFGSASNIRMVDGDKTRDYGQLELLLTEIFGCRGHAKHDCEDELCRTLLGYVKDKAFREREGK